jgi:hypothetical protein
MHASEEKHKRQGCENPSDHRVTSSESAKAAKHENENGSREQALSVAHPVHLLPYAVKM